MILIDADLLLIDIRYPNDSRFSTNRQVLDHLGAEGVVVGMTLQALLEVIGVLSFNLSAHRIPRLLYLLPLQYGLAILPHPQQQPDYAACFVNELIAQMSRQMALGDAVQALQIEKFASTADCLLSWNAKHFSGKMLVPVMTPQDWLTQS